MALIFDNTLNQCWKAGAGIWAYLEGAEASQKIYRKPAAGSQESGLFRGSQLFFRGSREPEAGEKKGLDLQHCFKQTFMKHAIV